MVQMTFFEKGLAALFKIAVYELLDTLKTEAVIAAATYFHAALAAFKNGQVRQFMVGPVLLYANFQFADAFGKMLLVSYRPQQI